MEDLLQILPSLPYIIDKYRTFPRHEVEAAKQRMHAMYTTDFPVDGLSEKIATAMIDIKREAEEHCSLATIEEIVKSRREKWYLSHHFWEFVILEYTYGWRKGRVFDVYKDHTLLMTPTNMAIVSWLDLAECSVGIVNKNDDSEKFSSILGTSVLIGRNEYDLAIRDKNLEKELQHHTREYLARVEELMEVERSLRVAQVLARNWDQETFLRYITSVEFLFRVNPDFHLGIFPRLLIEHCTDSKLITYYFMLITSIDPSLDPYAVECILTDMNVAHLHFFLMHITLVTRLHPLIDDYEAWILYDLRLVEIAITFGQMKSLELLVGFGWLHECSFHPTDTFQELDWPREVARTWQDTAIQKTAKLTFYLIDGTLWSEAPGTDLTQIIRLFWRYVEYPFVSLGDLRRLVEIIDNGDYPDDLGFRIKEDVLRDSVSPFLDIYPTDCLKDTYQPRSLMHLCRCKIRDTMTYLFMGNVKALPLPEVLKQYLWLKL